MLPAPLSLGLAGLALLAGFSQWQVQRIEARFPPTGEFVSFEGARIHLTRREPAGPLRGTVLLLHGASGNQADMMGALGNQLAEKGFRVVAPDRPGHGWSERPGGRAEASPAAQARILRGALKVAGIEKAIVVGHSWSGALASNFALDHADFTQGLVLVSPVTHPWPGGVSWYYTPASTPVVDVAFSYLLGLPAGLASISGGVAGVFKPQLPPTNYLDKTGAQLVLRPAEFMANAQDVAGLKAFVTLQAPRMTGITQPTGIIAGDSDDIVLTRIHSLGSARDIKGSTLKILPGVGHSPQWSDPDAVIGMIEDVAGRVMAGR